jgi:alkylated DNA repair dioxygenase AlkB
MVDFASAHSVDFAKIPKKYWSSRKMQKKLLVCCKPGDLILFDSRTIHCNSPSLLKIDEMREIYLRNNGLYNINKLSNTSPEIAQNSEQKSNELEQVQPIKELSEDIWNLNINGHSDNNNEQDQRTNDHKHRFVDIMKRKYLRSRPQSNLGNNLNRVEYNGYVLDIILWEKFDPKYFRDGRSYIFLLPFNTSLMWIPRWLDQETSQHLKRCILSNVKFEQPTLRFDRKNDKEQIVGVTEVKQNRGTAWLSNHFDQTVQNRPDSDVLPAIALDQWSQCLMDHASMTAMNEFNSMLMVQYKDGRNNVGYHCDDDDGLGDNAVIASLSLGATRVFKIKSMQRTKQKIEIDVPLVNGSFLVMNAGFQKYWVHSIPKDTTVKNERINVTFRKYALGKDAIAQRQQPPQQQQCLPFLRMVSYVCMVPKSKIKDATTVRERIRAVQQNWTCSHSPHDFRPMWKPNNMKPRKIEEMKGDVGLIKSLIGMDLLNQPVNGRSVKKSKTGATMFY